MSQAQWTYSRLSNRRRQYLGKIFLAAQPDFNAINGHATSLVRLYFYTVCIVWLYAKFVWTVPALIFAVKCIWPATMHTLAQTHAFFSLVVSYIGIASDWCAISLQENRRRQLPCDRRCDNSSSYTLEKKIRPKSKCWNLTPYGPCLITCYINPPRRTAN